MKTWLVWIAAALPIAVSGCGAVEAIDRQDIFARYDRTVLRESTSADVLNYIQNPATEHLSQSESVLAAWGDDGKGRTHWFNIVAFDEQELAAARKYAFTMEDYRSFNAKPKPMLRLDIQAVMDDDTLNAAYPSRNQMQIEIIKRLRTLFSGDSQEVSYDSATLQSSSIMVNQVLHYLLAKLDRSPALAEDLSKPQGLEFIHMTLGTSRVRMLIEDNIIKLKIKAGKKWFTTQPFEKHDDVINM